MYSEENRINVNRVEITRIFPRPRIKFIDNPRKATIETINVKTRLR
jgi:hypothetical protein